MSLAMMFYFSSSVCRHVVCRRSFRLVCNNFAQNKPHLESSNYETYFIPTESLNQAKPGLSFTTKCLEGMKKADNVHWDWLTKKLEGLEMNNIPTKILQACIRLDKPDLGLKYYDYLVEKGVELSPVDLMLFSKLISSKKAEIKKHEQMLIKLYNDIKEFLHSSLLIRKFLMEVFVEIPSCFKDIVKRGRHPTVGGGYLPVIQKALELNMPEAAFEFMKDSDFCVNANFIENYIEFCISRAEEGKFSIDLINQLITVCKKRTTALSHKNLLKPLSALVSVLNKHGSYQWSVHECEINEKHECSKCGSTLLPNNISNKEFAQLKDYFFRQSFIESDVFLSSTTTELQKFLKSLETIEPYTLVLDGLNVFYKTNESGVKFNTHLLKHFLDKGHKVLTIGKIHSKMNLTKAGFLKKNHYKSRAQFFFTSNTSDDDVFLLYAALYGGSGTYFLTGDFLSSYSKILDEDMKSIFLKWQLSHQYFIKYTMEVVPPFPHCGLSQMTVKTGKQYIWHLSQQNTSRATVSVVHPINWYCLKAEKKS